MTKRIAKLFAQKTTLKIYNCFFDLYIVVLNLQLSL